MSESTSLKPGAEYSAEYIASAKKYEELDKKEAALKKQAEERRNQYRKELRKRANIARSKRTHALVKIGAAWEKFVANLGYKDIDLTMFDYDVCLGVLKSSFDGDTAAMYINLINKYREVGRRYREEVAANAGKEGQA